jgi:hypothetical protein
MGASGALDNGCADNYQREQQDKIGARSAGFTRSSDSSPDAAATQAALPGLKAG